MIEYLNMLAEVLAAYINVEVDIENAHNSHILIINQLNNEYDKLNMKLHRIIRKIFDGKMRIKNCANANPNESDGQKQ